MLLVGVSIAQFVMYSGVCLIDTKLLSLRIKFSLSSSASGTEEISLGSSSRKWLKNMQDLVYMYVILLKQKP